LNSELQPAPIHVVVGVVIDGAGRVLIAQRTPGKHMAGSWEFPGGKLEAGESRVAGVARELREELGIIISAPRPLMRLRHVYPHVEVLLDVWVIRHFSGEPAGLDGQALRWCAQEELAAVGLLPADKPIIAMLRLPEILTVAVSSNYRVSDFAAEPEPPSASRAVSKPLSGVFCDGVAEARMAAAGGADFLALRGVLESVELAELCDTVAVPVFARDIELEAAWALGASGVNQVH
jgi:mutator protein MutT